jgi:hypothetical protein
MNPKALHRKSARGGFCAHKLAFSRDLGAFDRLQDPTGYDGFFSLTYLAKISNLKSQIL